MELESPDLPVCGVTVCTKTYCVVVPTRLQLYMYICIKLAKGHLFYSPPSLPPGRLIIYNANSESSRQCISCTQFPDSITSMQYVPLSRLALL